MESKVTYSQTRGKKCKNILVAWFQRELQKKIGAQPGLELIGHKYKMKYEKFTWTRL